MRSSSALHATQPRGLIVGDVGISSGHSVTASEHLGLSRYSDDRWAGRQRREPAEALAVRGC